MELEKYLEFVIAAAKEVFMTEDITAETRFEDDLHAKSINIAQLMNALEDEYDVEVPYMKFKRQETLQQAAEFVMGLVEEE